MKKVKEIVDEIVEEDIDEDEVVEEEIEAVEIPKVPCDKCNGTGLKNENELCPICGGDGVI